MSTATRFPALSSAVRTTETEHPLSFTTAGLMNLLGEVIADAAEPDEDEDPRGERACSECDEGVLVDLGHWRNPAADQVECNVCGFRS